MKNFILTKETDPRCIEFYKKGFPNLSDSQQESLRSKWVKNTLKKKNES